MEAGIGRYLAAQRRLRGISLAELSDATKIPLRSLERLESGVFDTTSDGFVRGFVRTVAVALGLDPDESVMRLLQEPPADSEVVGYESAGPHRRLLLAQVAAVAVVALAAVGVWQLVSFWMSPAAETEAGEVLLRRDPVRELALEARAAAPSLPGVRPPASAGLPPEVRPPEERGHRLDSIRGASERSPRPPQPAVRGSRPHSAPAAAGLR